jgi:protein-tyrosine sulfotransferase
MTTPDPILILGIMQRSGTNWMRDLLLCHSDCYGAKIQEDFLLANSHLLLRFGSSLYRSWPQKWRADQRVGPQERLHRILGEALLEFIGQERRDGNSVGAPSPPSGRRLVTKTPSVANLDHLVNFFPNSQLIILGRDGRAVVESIVQGFGWEYETAIRRWDSAAREILSFRASGGPILQRTILVKYEDLYSAPESELQRVLAFLNLDPTKYDLDQALKLPVRGSSVFGRELDEAERRRLERTEEFSPLDRAAHWGRWKHERFNRLAGESLEALGYHKVAPGRSSPLAPAIHWFYDAKWSVPRRLISVGFLLKRALGRSDPDFRDARSVYYARERHSRMGANTAAVRTGSGSGTGPGALPHVDPTATGDSANPSGPSRP